MAMADPEILRIPLDRRLRSMLARRHGFTAVARDVFRRSAPGRRLRSVTGRAEAQSYRLGRFAAPSAFGSICEARWAAASGRWEEAAEAWRLSLERTGRGDPVWHYELARAHAHLARVEASSAEIDRAFALAGSPSLLRRLGGAATVHGDWDVAAEAYRRRARLTSHPTTMWRAGRAFAAGGSYPEAAEMLDAALQAFGTGPSGAYSDLAEALRKQGDLEGAEAAVQAGWEVYPRSSVIHAASARVASDRRDWRAAVRRWPLAITLRRRPAPPSWLFHHGEALEHLGRFAEAVEVYDTALGVLAAIDEPWTHFASLEWEFRRAYCRCRIGSPDRVEPSLAVDVLPAAGGVGIDRDPAGEFSVDVTHLGLRIRGRAADRSVPTVTVAVDGRPIKQVDLNRQFSHPAFTFTVRHSALATFPASSRISVTAGPAPLAADLGGVELTVSVPHGDGLLFDRLDRGELFTKKGALVSPDSVGRSPEELLGAYTAVREVFATELEVELFVLYGTLLGCHRDGRFIPGDDDLDVGYLTACTDPVQVKAQALQVVDTVLRAGLDVTTRHGGGLFKVWIGDIDIDVYPIWFRDGRAWGYDAIPATPADYLPVQRREMLGTEILVPRDPDLLLAGTYGPDWRTPNPGFRYYRSKQIMNVLKSTYLAPSEARLLLEANEVARRQGVEIGSFAMHNGGAR